MTQPIHPMLFAMADAMLDAIRKEDVYVNCVDGDPAHTIIDGGTFDFTLVARAAIHALLEPDEGQIRLGCRAIEDAPSNAVDDEPDFPCSFWLHEARDCYRAMLRPLIGEGE